MDLHNFYKAFPLVKELEYLKAEKERIEKMSIKQDSYFDRIELNANTVLEGRFISFESIKESCLKRISRAIRDLEKEIEEI